MTSINKTHLLSWGIGFAMGALLVFMLGGLSRDSKKASMKVGLPGGGTVGVETEGRDDYATSLERIFANNATRGKAIAWLESHENVFTPTSERLADAVARQACGTIPDGVTPEAMKVKRDCAELPGIRRFRELASNHEVPFHYVGVLGDMGVPAGTANKPARGSANVCKPGELHGKRLQVASTDGERQIEVNATGYYLCTDAIPAPDIQLNPEDALTLFPNGALSKKEQVILVPLE